MSSNSMASTEVAAAGLRPVGAKLPLQQYLGQMLQRRGFMVSVPLGELRAQNMDTVLGTVWHLLNPVLLLGVYFLVFGVILPAGVRGGLDNYVGFLAVGIFIFQYMQKSITQGAKSIVANEGLIRSIPFPRAVLPVSTVMAQTVGFLPAVAVMFAFVVVTGEPFRWGWVLVPPLLVLMAVFNLGSAFVLGRLTHLLHDIANLLPFVFRLLFYGSGVLFPVDPFIGVDDPLRWLFTLNPVYAFLTVARALIMGLQAGWGEVASLLAWAVGVLVGGFLFFRAGEQQYGHG